LLQLVLSAGVSVDVANAQGCTALYTTAAAGQHAAVQMLLAAGANVDAPAKKTGWTPLYAAAAADRQAVVQLLLAAGANTNAAETEKGWTPLYAAAAADKHGLVQLLLAAGANVDAAETKNGWTPLYAAAVSKKHGLVQLLLEAGANVNAAEAQSGWTSLHAAAHTGCVQMMDRLLAAGANMDAVSKQGRTPLFEAAIAGNIHVMKLLLSKGANPKVHDVCRRTMLEAAVSSWECKLAVVQLLLEAWGQPQMPLADLQRCLHKRSLTTMGLSVADDATFMLLAKQLRKLYPAEAPSVFKSLQWGLGWAGPARAAEKVTTLLAAWASEVGNADEERAALRKREEGVAAEQRNVQQLIVSAAGMAQHRLHYRALAQRRERLAVWEAQHISELSQREMHDLLWQAMTLPCG
jgi:ankyrin repeat protein